MRGNVDVAREALRELWVAPHAYARVATIVRELFPGAQLGVAYDWSRDGRPGECGHTLGTGGGGWGALEPLKPKLASLKQYRLVGQDRFANRAVTTAELFSGRDAALEQARGELWAGLGALHYQLRAALFERGSLSVLVAVLKGRGGEDFSRAEALRLDRVTPGIRDALEAARAIGPIPGCSTTLGRVLDAFDRPAFIAKQSGAIVYANHAARKVYARRPEWFCAVLRRPQARALEANVTRIEHEGRSLFLIVPRDPPAAPLKLPPSLARVAALAAQGLSDKEIANALAMPLPTVRTYVRRIYVALGVNHRIALRAVWDGRKS